MMKVLVTGMSGFVGKELQRFLKPEFELQAYKRGTVPVMDCDAVIHLAGKAHDTGRRVNHYEYDQANTQLTVKLFDAFLQSGAGTFIFMSSVKAAADRVEGILTEETEPNPETPYGKSKLAAEKYLLSQSLPVNKRLYILRPCMIHGPGNKGNLNLLFKLVSKGIPWPLGAFENLRSFCSSANLAFVIRELLANPSIPSGIYQVADDEPVSTNALISLIAEVKGKPERIWNINRDLLSGLAKLGNILRLPLNEERFKKLTGNYIVSNTKIKRAMGKELPLKSLDGLRQTLLSFTVHHHDGAKL